MRAGIIVIGRNEGARLERCLDSVRDLGACTVYVDSGSDDGSPDLGRRLGVEVLELDPARPFSAARARNEGFEHLSRLVPGIEYVQFIDGDCELLSGWFQHASKMLDSHPDTAVVAGRLHERDPNASVYNRLCDLEWDAPPGEADEVGGIAMMRASALIRSGGFDSSLIAGEEPELCLRLRHAGWKILRLPTDMAVHDAGMTRFGQWWKRAVRSGHATAEGAWQHGGGPFRYRIRETTSIAFWGAVLPAGIAVGSILIHPAALILLAGYPALAARIYRGRRARANPADSLAYAVFCTLSKFPEALGVGRFHYGRLRGKERGIVE